MDLSKLPKANSAAVQLAVSEAELKFTFDVLTASCERNGSVRLSRCEQLALEYFHDVFVIAVDAFIKEAEAPSTMKSWEIWDAITRIKSELSAEVFEHKYPKRSLIAASYLGPSIQTSPATDDILDGAM